MGILADLNAAARNGDIACMDAILQRQREENDAAVAEARKFNADYESEMQRQLAKLTAMAASLRK